MEEIKIFNSPQFGEIRTTGTSENPLFCLSDVCSVLGLRQGDVKQRLDKDVVSTQPLETTGGIQQANFVNEDGLYDVILDSRKPQAKAFRKWVTSEVLPAIRKTGGYIAINHDETTEEIMARALTIAQATLAKRDERLKQLEEKTEYQQKQIEQKDARISVLQPKAFFADCIMQSDDCISIGEMANILKQNGLFGKGQNSFFEWLRWSGYLLNRGSRYNLPSQRSMRLGIMRIAEQQRGSVFINRKAVITPYGQRYFIELFGKSSTAGQCTINFIYK